jgi:hypothetical protein
MKRFGLIAVVTAIALLVPTRAASDTPPPTIEVSLSLTDLPAPIVNLSVPESQPNVNIELPETPAPVVNVDVALPEGLTQPTTVVVEPAPILPAEVVYQDRTVEVERIVEVPACLDYADLPYFDLANALTVAFPGEPWSLNGSHYNGLVWHGETPQPDMTAIIGGWLTHLTESC